MARPFSDFVDSVRLADCIEDERYYIKTEQAEIRAYIKKPDPEIRPRVVSKLVFLDMQGENVAYGQMETMALMADDRFSFKRVGYICAAQLLDQTTDLSVLVTQTLLRDLKSPLVHIQNLALVFIANLGTPEICRAVATEVQRLLSDPSPSVVKRAGMATVRVVQTNPDLALSYKNSVQQLLNSPVHGVILAGMNMVHVLVRSEPKLAKSWSQFALPFTKILKSLHTSRPMQEFCFGVFNDPYMQVKTMEALALIGIVSDELEGVLQSIISSTDTQRNVGRALLYQAVDTIVAISKNASLRGLAFNQVGRLLNMRDPNVLYSALSSFARVLSLSGDEMSRGNLDSMALQRYKGQIVKCLDHQDPSIRRRALDVISALIDANNVETLIPEILVYIKLADAEFRSELVTKIYTAAQKFAPSKIWSFNTVHAILIDSGDYVSSEIVSSFTELIGKSPEIQEHAVYKLGESIANFSENQTLLQVTAFVLGEFAMEDKGFTADLKQVLLMPQTKTETKLYIMTALAKMCVRFGNIAEVQAVMDQLVTDSNLEIQQRAGEIRNLLARTDVNGELFAPISATSEDDGKASIAINSGSHQTTAENVAGDDLLSLMLDSKQPQQPKDDLLGLLDTPNPTPTNIPSSGSLLEQLAAAPVQQNPSVPRAGVELLRKNDFIIYGQSKLNPSDQRMVALCLSIYSTSGQVTEFTMDYRVGPGWQLNIQRPDGNVLTTEKPITQIVYLLNQTNAPFQLNFKATYKFGSQPLSEVGVITSIPSPQ